MAHLKRSQILKAYNDAQSFLLDDRGERSYASRQIQQIAKSFDFSESYDIFLSHSYDDARIVKQIRDQLATKGYSVYVDWIEDTQLDRGQVSSYSAMVLKNRMNNCASLIYLTSDSAEKSVWMPWELGYMDARTGRVAVAPVLDDENSEDFEGREYLGIYPYLDLTADSFYIQSDSSTWVSLGGWMQGQDPTRRV